MNIYQRPRTFGRPSARPEYDTESDTENNRLARLGLYADDTESDTENNLLAHQQDDAEMMDAARILRGLSVAPQQSREAFGGGYNLRASTRAQHLAPTRPRLAQSLERSLGSQPAAFGRQPRAATQRLTYDEMSRAEQDAVGGLSAVFDDEAAYRRDPISLQPPAYPTFLDADGRLLPTADRGEYRRNVRDWYETRYAGMTLPPPYDLHPRGRVTPSYPRYPGL